MKNLKIASWNIEGGRKIKSHTRFDYTTEDLSYFVKEIKKVNPDVVFLQEVHFNNHGSMSGRIAKLLRNTYIYDYVLHPSHIDKNKKMGISILSNKPFRSTKNIIFPNPEFDLFFKNGKKAVRHEKGLQISEIDGIYFANTHLLPIGLFNHLYTQDEGKQFWDKLIQIFISNLKTPLIFAGDFSGDFEGKFYGLFDQVSDKFFLKDALYGLKTRNMDNEGGTEIYKTDHIFFSKELKLINSGIVKTKTDHFLCYAEFEFQNE